MERSDYRKNVNFCRTKDITNEVKMWEKIFKLCITKAYHPWSEHVPTDDLERYKRPSGKMGKDCKQCTEEEIQRGSIHMYMQGSENSPQAPTYLLILASMKNIGNLHADEGIRTPTLVHPS